MQTFKILVMMILFWSLAAFANETHQALLINADHPFLKIGYSPDGKASVYIGAFGDILPQKTQDGNVLLLALTIEDIADDENPKGQRYEFAITANCKQKIAKILPFWGKPDENSPGVSRYNLTGDDLNNMIMQELEKQEMQPVEPGSMLSIVVSSGCHYLGEDYSFPKAKSHKREWRA
jgi:hypothetical protein